MKNSKNKFEMIDDVDLFVEQRQMTKAEELKLSQIIAAHKEKNKKRISGKRKQAA